MESSATKSADAPHAAPAPPPPAPPPTPRLFYLTLGVVVLFEAWSLRAADPDFFFPNIFAGPVIAFCVAVALASRVRRRRLRLGLLWLAFAAPLATLAFEVAGSRRVNSGVSRMVPVSDRLLRYHYRPGAPLEYPVTDQTLVVSDDWIADVPHRVEKAPDTYRVIVLGDSVPADPYIPLADRFPRALERDLAPLLPPGKKAEVLNLAVEGYTTLQEVRLFERIGRKYRPDLVIVAHVLNDAWLQDPVRGRVSNSFYAYRLLAVADWAHLRRISNCTVSGYFDQEYTFDLLVRNAYERLKIFSDLDGFAVLVATMPIIERFDDPVCLRMYDMALGAARDVGFAGTRVVDSFAGRDHRLYQKPNWLHSDGTHPNPAGHHLIAEHLAKVVGPLLSARAVVPPGPPPPAHLEGIPFDRSPAPPRSP